MLQNDGQISMGGDFSPIKLKINQLYGIEINDFAVKVAKTALWIAESQMMRETEDIVQMELNFLPLKSYANIVEGNALELNWHYLYDNDKPSRTAIYAKSATLNIVAQPMIHYNDIDLYTPEIIEPEKEIAPLPPLKYDYIMGNPPFVGARLMSDVQKESMVNVFGSNWKNMGNLDFVSAWYKKASDFIRQTETRCAFVSTNSISQGEQVANLWKPIFENGIRINFAYHTFKWDSESEQKAHVHCIIVGFSWEETASSLSQQRSKIIFNENGEAQKVENINAYLTDAPNVFIESRTQPLCGVPKMDFGNMPNDAKGLLSNYSSEEKETLCRKYPELGIYFRQLLGAEEYINKEKRYCLWFKDANLSIIRKCPEIYHAIEKIREARAKSSRTATQKLADYPYLFGEIRQPSTPYIIVPRVSSERRKYIPIGFVSPEIIVNDSVQIIPDASLYHFGVLTSGVHMAWMRAVCGRLKSDYRYSKNIVYNNFPWCTPTIEQKVRIEKSAQDILDARTHYPNSSLADLYDETTMPIELRKAHQTNDKAVMEAYGFSVKDYSESDCVARLFEMYRELVEKNGH